MSKGAEESNRVLDANEQSGDYADLDGFDLVFAKIAFSVDKEEFERF